MEPTVSRYAVKSGADQGGLPLLDMTTLDYLFSQVCVHHRRRALQVIDVTRVLPWCRCPLCCLCLSKRLNMNL